jgi:hypothetical protein
LLLLAAGSADALTITVTGNAGADGVAVNGEPGEPADAIAISADPANDATATGGRGGSSIDASGGAGGEASAVAETNVAAPASARATATGGKGGDSTGFLHVAGDGGDATAAAHAIGAGGSQARAFATGGRGGQANAGAVVGGAGGAATLIDAVSGSDATALVLEQRALGGDGGSSLVGGAGGDATSTGDFENTAGGDLLVTLSAIGGSGGFGPTRGASGGARVGGSATSSGAGDAAIEAYARTAGALVLDPVSAHATGSGDASASLEAELLADGSTLTLDNDVDATAGSGAALAFRQTAKADAASESRLDVPRSAALLTLEANAEGGDAAIFVRGSNDAGDLRLGGQALGGRSELTPFDARAEFEAHTSGDGHDIEIGGAGGPAGALGGRGRAGNVAAGDAVVIATAMALGNSAVHIDVFAEGGAVEASSNGAATARAEGSGGGTEAVDVTATARGGDEVYSAGGDALADALATGLGAVSARAIAHGGIYDGLPLPGGAGFARARASGASGEVEAVASSAILFDGELADDEQEGPIEVRLAASVACETSVAASSQRFDFAPGSDDAALDGFIRSAYHAGPSVMAAALAGNPLASAAGLRPRRELFALVELGIASGGGTAQTFEADIILGHPSGFDDFDDVPEAVLVSFLDPAIDSAAFGSLTLRSWDTRDVSDVYEVVFTSALDALAFLDDGRLLFDGEPTQRHLEIVFETTGAEGAFFLDLVVAAVPEPSAALLLALSLLGMGLRRAW